MASCASERIQSLDAVPCCECACWSRGRDACCAAWTRYALSTRCRYRLLTIGLTFSAFPQSRLLNCFCRSSPTVYPESHQGSVHSSWSRHGGRPRSYYDDEDHYLSYTSAAPPGHHIPPGSAGSHAGAPGVAGSHGSAPVAPPLAPSSGSHRSRHSHRHSISGHIDAERHPDDSSRRSRHSHRERSRDRERSRSRHSHHSQASYKTYGSYSPVPFETPPRERTRRLSHPKQPKEDPVEGMRPPPPPSAMSQHSVAPSHAPSVSSTWSYHAPAPPPPGVVGSTASHHSHHSTSPYTSQVQPHPAQPQPYDNPYRTSPTLSSATVPRHAHRHSVSNPMSSPGEFHDMQNYGALVNPAVSAPPPAGGGIGFYQYAGWSAPPLGQVGSAGGVPIAPGSAGGVPIAPGSAGGGLPPAQYAFTDHSRGVPHTGSSHGSGMELVTARDKERRRDARDERRSKHGRGRSRSVDALEAARQKDYEERMRVLQSQGSTGSVGSRRGHRSSHSYQYPPGPYGVPAAYSASGHSHHSSSRYSPVEGRERDRDRDRDRERDRNRDRERDHGGRSKSRERNVLRKARSESRRRRDDDDDRERGPSRSKSRPRHREDYDEMERRHHHERHIGEDEARDIEREVPGILKKSRSRPGSSSHHTSSSSGSTRPSKSSSSRHRHHHSHSHSHHHHSPSTHSPSHHRHSHSHSALVGSSASSRARHERRKESLDQQNIKPRFDDGAVGDPRRERESGIGAVYPVEVYPGKESSRSRERERKKERRATVSGGGSGWFPV